MLKEIERAIDMFSKDDKMTNIITLVVIAVVVVGSIIGAFMEKAVAESEDAVEPNE